MVISKSGKLLLALAVGLAVSGVNAKEAEKTEGFIPSVNVRQGYTDNVYRARKDEKHSWITTVKPGGEYIKKHGANKYTLGGNAMAGYYTVDSRNDYVDWSGYARSELEFDPRNHLDLGGKKSHKHDPIGTGASEGASTLQGHPDEYTQTDGDFKYTYGAKGARGKLVLRDIYMNKEYTNNRDTTEKLDRTDNELRATTYLRVMPKTTMLLEGRDKTIDYLADHKPGYVLSSDEKRLYVGAEWEATAKTTGAVRLGRAWKDMREKHGAVAPVDDYSVPSWEASVTWAPLSYSSLILDTERNPTEASVGSGFIDRIDNKLTWKHEWSSYLNSKVFARRYTDEYVGTARHDNTQSLGAGLEYNLNKWVDLSADYTYEVKNSNQDSNDYDGNLILFGAKFMMD